MHQDPGGRSTDPTRDWARLAYECPGVSCGVVGQQWLAVGSEALNTAVLWAVGCAGISLFAGGRHYHHSVHFSLSVVSNSLRPHGLQHSRPPFHHQLPEFTQTHVHWVCDDIQTSHPLSSSSPLAFNLSQHQEESSSSESVLHIRWPKYWSFSFSISPFKEIQAWFPLGFTGWISLLSKGPSRVFSNTTVQKHQFVSAQLSLYSKSHSHIWLLEKP